jgi:hypothetical protein
VRHGIEGVLEHMQQRLLELIVVAAHQR